MSVMEALTRLVVVTSRFGDHLLSRKASGIIVAALAFACGAGLARAPKGGPPAARAAAAPARPADPARAEVSIRDTRAGGPGEWGAVFEGEYQNHVYGYSVEIPAGMVGLGSAPPAPQHGFGIDLDDPGSTAWVRGSEFPKSYLHVDGSYNSLGWERLDDAVTSNLGLLREKGLGVRVQARRETLLGGLPAVRVVALYVRDGVEMVSDETVAFRVEGGGEVSAVYTVSLSTPRSKYARDRLVLEVLTEGWCLQPAE